MSFDEYLRTFQRHHTPIGTASHPKRACVQQYRCECLSVVTNFSSLHALQVYTTHPLPPQPLNTLIPNFRCVTRFFSHCDKHFSNHSLPICVNYAGTRVSQCPSQYYCLLGFCSSFIKSFSTQHTGAPLSSAPLHHRTVRHRKK